MMNEDDRRMADAFQTMHEECGMVCATCEHFVADEDDDTDEGVCCLCFDAMECYDFCSLWKPGYYDDGKERR